MESSLGVVIPAYEPDVERLSRYVRELDERLAPEVCRIELDAPSRSALDRLADLPATVSTSPRRRGKGAAITAGFEALSTDLLLFVDADGSTPAPSAERVLGPLYDEEADLAAGSRRHPRSVVRSHQTFARRRLGDGFAWTARRLLDAKLYDYQCGAKALTREAWQVVRRHLYEPGFAWDIELLAVAAALDLRIAEVPIEWEDQPGSTVDPVGTTLDLARALLVVRHRVKRLQNSPVHSTVASLLDETALVDRP